MATKTNNTFYCAKCPHCQHQQMTSYQELANQQGSITCGNCEKVFGARGNLIKPNKANQPTKVTVDAHNDLPSPIQTANPTEKLLRKAKEKQSQLADDVHVKTQQSVKLPKQGILLNQLLKKNLEKNTEIAIIDTVDDNQPSNTATNIVQKYLDTSLTQKPVFELSEPEQKSTQIHNTFVFIEEVKDKTHPDSHNQELVYTLEQDYSNPIPANQMTGAQQKITTEINWTIASVTALIVLILQVLYIVL